MDIRVIITHRDGGAMFVSTETVGLSCNAIEKFYRQIEPEPRQAGRG